MKRVTVSFWVSEHVVRYSSPQAGMEMGEAGATLADASYDGLIEGGMMSGGIGQLTDGIYATHPANPAYNSGSVPFCSIDFVVFSPLHPSATDDESLLCCDKIW